MKTINKAIVADVTQRYVNNLLALWEMSEKSSNWYDVARQRLLEIADTFNVSEGTVAYVAATLSPALSWDKNIESVWAFFAEWYGAVDYAHYQQCAYGTNVQKCTDYMLGLRQGKPTGQKVSTFYANLLGDYSVVTLDRHAIRAARWGRRNMQKASGEQKICKQEFRVVQDAYLIAAQGVGVSVTEFQATLWMLFAR